MALHNDLPLFPFVVVAFAMLAGDPLRLGALLGVSFGVAALVSLSAWCHASLLLAPSIGANRNGNFLMTGRHYFS